MILAGGHPLHVGYILRARGRWNRPGVDGCLYTSLERDGAVDEARKTLRAFYGARPIPPQDLVSLYVRVSPVLDLGDPAVRTQWGAPLERLTGDGDADIATCRSLADLARLQGFNAILSPSAAHPGATNLNLYIGGPAGAYDLREGPDRVRLTLS